MKIKKGDTVKILSGKDRGKQGVVVRAFPREGKIVVEKMNVVKKHRKPRKTGERGQIMEIAKPFSVSNAMIVCPQCAKPTRVGYKTSGEHKTRMCKKCQKAL